MTMPARGAASSHHGLRVLVLRPRAAGLRTATRLAALGHEAVLAPLLTIAPTHAPVPEGPFDALAVTSAAALHACAGLPEAMKTLPMLAVGEQTALLAMQSGFSHVHYAAGERHSMADMARHVFGGGAVRPRVLLALGLDHKPDTPALLAQAGLDPVPWIVYEARAATALPEAAREALQQGQIDAVLHYSRRSATVALDVMRKAQLSSAFAALQHLCLSGDVAKALDGADARLFVADRPHEDALLALLDEIDRKQGSP